MGPNLTRLLEQSKYNGRYDGTDAIEIIECDRAQDKIYCILSTNGEALIRLLEELEANPTDGRRHNARTLLAKLEQEVTAVTPLVWNVGRVT